MLIYVKYLVNRVADIDDLSRTFKLEYALEPRLRMTRSIRFHWTYFVNLRSYDCLRSLVRFGMTYTRLYPFDFH